MGTFLVTGGCGFIGSNFVLQARRNDWGKVINLDKLTYASNPKYLASLQDDPDYIFVKGDIGDRPLLDQLLVSHQPNAIIHFAAESHVDRSIQSPEIFIQTNVLGTFHLLEASLSYWQSLSPEKQQTFRFLHISTDEVYGSLDPTDPPFTERSPYQPNSPYAASKASADHLVRSYYVTYGLPILCTNCSNNYGPHQFPEKLIPLMIANALVGKPLPVYGDGRNIRDWIYVIDHCEALYQVLRRGQIGATYNIGGMTELANIDLVKTICELLASHPDTPDRDYLSLITFVTDRLGHDRRYAIDCSKISQEIGWQPQQTFVDGLKKTVDWYIDND
ncbi:dTDP-glucose 4,6-dehydratase [[Leptolyngbya] sp. PCC 7376]|uniref:dTDP-glucose 4,6-dehydratase n=1 Tax=[Leptolyngbya] sp. PCC 7376 TaxID=111781 RepID=UPI00029F0D64|nr:dTDP-glucose 4,6-dehydratase [[Leptolyngbya] sp. PCC 7376]AFY37093.1 dTDP-glucose 4,6-dehydratase [[Leptolyngbya] sp. PCC 7376]